MTGIRFGALLTGVALAIAGCTHSSNENGPTTTGPLTVCYSAQPNEYFNDHARDIARFYDGFFFTIGSWDEGAVRVVGMVGAAPGDPSWREAVRKNIRSLKSAGVAENFLTVHFSSSGEWPSASTLLSESYTQKMSAILRPLDARPAT